MSNREKKSTRQPPRRLTISTTSNLTQDSVGTSRRRSSTLNTTKSIPNNVHSPLGPRSSTELVTGSGQSWTLSDSLFDPRNLSTTEGLELASQALVNILYSAKKHDETTDGTDSPMQSQHGVSNTISRSTGRPSHLGSVLNTTVETLKKFQPWTLPLLLSYNVQINQIFKTAISQSFPASCTEYVSAPFFLSLLQSLRKFFWSLEKSEMTGPSEFDSEFSTMHQQSQETEKALASLTRFDVTNSPTSPGSRSSRATRSARASSFGVGSDDVKITKRRQTNNTRSGIVPSSTTGDDSLYGLGMRYPTSLEEKEELEGRLLKTMSGILTAYLDRLLLPRVHDAIKVHIAMQNSSITTEYRVPVTVLSDESDPSLQETVHSLGFTHPVSNESVSSQLLNSLPIIQVLEDDIEGFGSWRITLSGNAMKDLRKIRKDSKSLFEIVLKKLKELSLGAFSRDNQKRLEGKEKEVPIYEAKMTRDTRLIYCIDCVPDTTGERVTQALKVFGIYTHAQLDSRLWAAVSSHSPRRGSEYVRRCNFRQQSPKGGIYVDPCSWPPAPEIIDEKLEVNVDEDMILELHTVFTHQKFILLTQDILESIVSDKESAHPFTVSPHEREVIYYPSSCFVIGRSGTGKTTTMLFKMLARERTSHKMKSGKIRQVFITQSRVLAEKVEEYFHEMLQSYAEDLRSAEEVEWYSMRKKEAEKTLFDYDEDYEGSRALPKRLSELEDRHFPLFLTFDKLCGLLEGDLGARITDPEDVFDDRNLSHQRPWKASNGVTEPFDEEETMAISRESRRRILFEDFLSKYWPRFSQSGAKLFDPSLIWNEFQGVICGSELSLQFPNGVLSRETYESTAVSFRKQSNFADRRSHVYDLFEYYKKLKALRNEYDGADRTHSLLRMVQDSHFAMGFDYIYVDEVQDNLMIDAQLLRGLCKNPHGLFWAGDTAQQIMSTAFRFSDLTSFLYRIEENDPLVISGRRRPVHPREFVLAVNYRSHGGITDCAHSVVHLMTALWPDSVDTLPREQGFVDGPKPVFFSGRNDDSDCYEPFLLGRVSTKIEFGAEQCILVRNKQAKERLRRHIGIDGVIMTIYESKGLEFNDVMLYNFFQDSTVKSEWRVVLNAIDEEKRIGVSLPTFDPIRHLGVCSELKFLYVGLTRARNRLWIWDSSLESESMKSLWESKNLIEVKRPNDSTMPQLAVQSSPEEWEKMGLILFSRGKFEQAAVCFQRAQKDHLRDISEAYHALDQAKLVPVETQASTGQFSKAAKLFERCAKLYDSHSREAWSKAAECFIAAGKYRSASNAFCSAGDLTQGATYAMKNGHFDRTVEILGNTGVDRAVKQRLTKACQIAFLQSGEFGKARRISDSDEKLLELCRLFCLDIVQALVYFKKYEEAGDSESINGKPLLAVQLYEQASTISAARKAEDLLVREMWRSLPAGVDVNGHSSATVKNLISLFKKLGPQSTMNIHEVLMFEYILAGNWTDLLGLVATFSRFKNHVAVIRCYLVYFQLGRWQDCSPEQSHSLLDQLQCLRSHLATMLALTDYGLLHSNDTQKLLGFAIHTRALNYEVLPFPTSRMGPDSRRPPVLGDKGRRERILSFHDAITRARTLLSSFLTDALLRTSEIVAGSNIFRKPCIKHLSARCHTTDCQWPHFEPENAPMILAQRLGLCMHQVTVINQVDSLLERRDRRLRLTWMSKLFNVVHPQSLTVAQFSDMSSLDPSYTLDRGLSILRDWMQAEFYDLDPMNACWNMKLFLLATIFDHYAPPNYILRVQIELEDIDKEKGCRKDPKTGERHPLFLDLFNSLFAHESGAVEEGIAYLQHTLTTNMETDAHMLICVLEITTACLLAGIRPELCGLILPKSWLFTLGQRRSYPEADIWAFVSHLIKPLMGFVQNIRRGCSHLILNGWPISEGTSDQRTSLIERVFRCLILAGTNASNEAIQRLIGRNIMTLSYESCPADISRLNRYFDAEDWDDLFNIMVHSSSAPGSDRLLQLTDTEKPVKYLMGVKQVTLDDAFSISFQNSIKTISGTTSNQRTSTKGHDTEPLTPLLDISHLSRPFTYREHIAARIIQRFYREYRRKRSEEKMTPWKRWSSEYAASLGENKRWYSALIDGLPHLMICLEAYMEQLAHRKAKVAESAKTGKLERYAALQHLESVSEEQVIAAEVFEDLKPSSFAINCGDIVPRLKDKYICKVLPGLKSVCVERPSLQVHLNRVLWDILQERNPIRKPPKPTLNTSDIL